MRAVKCRPNPSALGKSAGAACVTGSTRILKLVKCSPEENGPPTSSILLQDWCSLHFFPHDDTNSRHWRDRLLCGADAHEPVRKSGHPHVPARLRAHAPNYLCADTTTPPAREPMPVVERPAMWLT